MSKILPEELKDFSYFYNKIPLYLKNTKFVEHFKMQHELLLSISNCGEKIINALNIFDEKYLENLDCDKDATDGCEILEKIAKLLGVDRNIVIETEKESLLLTNEELLLLTRVQCIHNNYDGSWSQITDFYQSIGMDVLYKTAGTREVNVYWYYDNDSIYSENLKKIFLNTDLLLVKSMGIRYITSNPIDKNAVFGRFGQNDFGGALFR